MAAFVRADIAILIERYNVAKFDAANQRIASGDEVTRPLFCKAFNPSNQLVPTSNTIGSTISRPCFRCGHIDIPHEGSIAPDLSNRGFHHKIEPVPRIEALYIPRSWGPKVYN